MNTIWLQAPDLRNGKGRRKIRTPDRNSPFENFGVLVGLEPKLAGLLKEAAKCHKIKTRRFCANACGGTTGGTMLAIFGTIRAPTT